MWQKPLYEILHDHLSKVKASRPSYSLRALARKLKVGPGALSEFLRGKRKLSADVGIRIVEGLSLEPEQRDSLLALIRQEQESSRRVLNAEEFMTVAHWSTAALMCLFEFPEPPDSLAEVAEKIGIPESQIQDKIESLKALGLIQESPSKKIRSSGFAISTSEDIPDDSIRKFHQDSLELSQTALKSLPTHRREFTAVTFSSTKEKLEIAKKEIRKFRETLSHKLATPVRDEVYQLQICFYPLTDWEKSSTVEK